jgi:hypothetical protein
MSEQVFNNKSTFTQDAEFLKDVYIYGTLHYEFLSAGDDDTEIRAQKIFTEDIVITGGATLNNLKVTGISTFDGPVGINSGLNVSGLSTFNDSTTFNGITTFNGPVGINSDLNVTGVATFLSIDVDDIDVGIATVRERFELTSESGTNYLVGFAAGPRAGKVGIGSTLPDRDLDLNDLRVHRDIYDSVGSEGVDGYYLTKDAAGIRWVAAAPDAQTDGFFVKNEGVLVGVGSFTIMNFIGTRTGGDLVNATQNSVNPFQVDVDIIDHWTKNASGVHTTVNVGINQVNPAFPLDVNGEAKFRNTIDVDGAATLNDTLDVDGGTTLNDTLDVDGATTLNSTLDVDGTTTLNSTLDVDGDTTFNSGTDSTSPTNGSVQIDGGVGIVKNLNVGGAVDIDGDTTLDKLTADEQAKFNAIVRIDAPLRVHGHRIVGTATTSVVAFSATFANIAGLATYAKQAGFSTLAGIATFARQAGFATAAGIATFAKQAGFSTSAGISTFAKQAGFSTSSGIATFSKQAGFSTVSGFATNAARAGIATFIQTVQTLTNQDYFITFVENSTSTGIETLRVDAGIKYNPSSDRLLLEGELELNSTLKDINNSTGAGKTDYRLASVGTGVSWRPPGVETKNILYVTKDGDDSNTGLLEGDAKATIGGACEVAQDGDTIYVRPGTYFENNPIGLRTDVSITGQDIRLVTVVPNNRGEDLFHVRRGCLIENMNFAGNSVAIGYTGAMVAFPPLTANQNSGYVAPGPANEGPSGRWRSPYVRNCTNFATDSIGMKIDGNHANAAYTGTNNLGQDLKSMVVDAYTQYNQNGIGVSITNNGYAQLVSIFTINCKIAIFCSDGGQCDLTNSNSSFGIFGLFADGTSGDEFTGITTGAKIADVDVFQVFGVRDTASNVRKPFDGQGAFFKINLDDYSDTGVKSGIVTEPLRVIRSIKVTDGGSGYSAGAPPAVSVSAPLGPEGVLAELSANVSAAGTVSSIDIIASGRNFLPPGTGSNQQNIQISFTGSGGAVAEAITDPILFTVDRATEPTTNTGLSTVTFNEFVPYAVGTGVSMSFRRLSRIITSSHSFEYVGAGTDINRANPFQGGEPNPDNEIVAINGGQIPFTSTDQKGNFRIGQGLVIDQTTSTISGRDFNRAIQANLTPLILALGG